MLLMVLASCNPVQHHFLRQDHEFDKPVDWEKRIAEVRQTPDPPTTGELLRAGLALEAASLILPASAPQPLEQDRNQVPAFSLRDAQLALTQEELLLALETSRTEHPVLVALSNRTLRVVELEIVESSWLIDRMTSLQARLGSPQGSENWRAEPKLAELSRVLLGPVLDLLQEKNTLLVPCTNALAGFPLGALLLNTEEPEANYLVETHQVRLLSSLDVLWSSQAIIADGFRVGAASPSLVHEELNDLKAEARLIRKIFPGEPPFDISTGTMESFVAWARGLRVAHLGGHAKKVESAGGETIALLRSGAEKEDVFLSGTALEGMELDIPLVFLSACSAGSFELGGWEGSLASGFLDAGCASVVAPLWNVGDMPASIFVSSFYRHYGPQDGATALSSAIRHMIFETSFDKPYYWAGYYIVQSHARQS